MRTHSGDWLCDDIRGENRAPMRKCNAPHPLRSIGVQFPVSSARTRESPPAREPCREGRKEGWLGVNPSIHISRHIKSQSAGKCKRRNAQAGQHANLILHEGNERRNDNCEATPHKSRYLEGYRFPPSGWHQDQTVFPLHYLTNGLKLCRTEVNISPDVPQYVSCSTQIFIQRLRAPRECV